MAHEHPNILVALAGQPNCGKSTIFNMLTGIHQHIANFPGVTVEKKSGHYHDSGSRVEVVDLPGTYSLSSYSHEERIARDFILVERPEVVVVVVDASNLRRHLYFALQLREMNIPVVMCLNMTDVAKRRGISVDTAALSKLAGMPVVETVGVKGVGAAELKEAIRTIAAGKGHQPEPWQMAYPEAVEKMLATLTGEIGKHEHLTKDFPVRWLALRLLENDGRRIVQHHTHDDKWKGILDLAESLRNGFAGGEAEVSRLIAAGRCDVAARIDKDCVKGASHKRGTLSDKVDRLACNMFSGFITAAVCVYLLFTLTFKISDRWEWIPWFDGEWTSLTGLFEWLFTDAISAATERFIAADSGALGSLVHEGIIAGVGGLMGFVPIIFVMFVFLAIIEDSGYIARIAFIFDQLMRVFGLQGQSVLPMIVGGGIMGGCAVPGIMATRTMKDPKERLLTMMIVPFMNCGAKVPVYILLTAAFFAAHKDLVMWSLVFISWALALVAAFILSRTAIKGESAPFLIDLPAYHLPSIGSVLRSAGNRTWMYVRKAGTVILAVTVVIWAMMYFPRIDGEKYDMQRQAVEAQYPQGGEELAEKLAEVDALEKHEGLSNSYAGRIGRALVPLSQFAGFNWRDNIALIGGFAAKEVVVSTLNTSYAMSPTYEEGDEEGELSQKLAGMEGWSPLKAFALIIFVMIYAPCFVTVAVIYKETGSWRWALFSTAYSTAFAYVLAVGIYQIGSLLGIGV